RPLALARWQLEHDAVRIRRMPRLLARKRARMEVSPFAFLRGAAPLFYRVLVLLPRLARGPDDEGLLSGDLHLENFGAYRPDRPSPRGDRVAFDLNDVDEAFTGPLHLDLLRLLTSALLAARGWGATAPEGLALAGAVLDGYARVRSGRPVPPPPTAVARLVERVTARNRRTFLERRTRGTGDERRFLRNDVLLRLSRSVRSACVRAFERYADAESRRSGVPRERLRILDVAFRVAGTGSLGALRVAVLVTGHGGRDGAWMFDMKAMGAPAGRELATRDAEPGPERVERALRTLLRHPPGMLGTVRLLGQGMLVRRLTPQEDRLDWASVTPSERARTLAFTGALAAAAHLRGAPSRPEPLSQKAGSKLLRSSVELAGLHEAVALSAAF
ncbi:MAG TPA: DUF2252 family protein, partial [Myxococcaceae bacterium]|nr:DUF2252 family protein [Myxococcaceae bacterium]